MCKSKVIFLFFLLPTFLPLLGQRDPKNSIKNSLNTAINFFKTHEKEEFKTYNLREFLHYSFFKIQKSKDFNEDSLLNVMPIFEDDLEIFLYYKRLHTKNKLPSITQISNQILHLKGLDKAMLWAIYADKLPPDSLVNKELALLTDSSSNIRQIAHGALVLKWASDLNYTSKIKNYSKIKRKYCALLPAKIEQIKPMTDSGMEGIVALLLLDRKDLIKPSWIERLIVAQKQDGSWLWNENVLPKNIKEHPTTLAIFILSAYLDHRKELPVWVVK